MLGRAVAGDFHSWEGTWRDFLAQGWPVLPIWALATGLHLALRPTPQRPHAPMLRAGLLPAVLMILAALIDVFVLGVPEHVRSGS